MDAPSSAGAGAQAPGGERPEDLTLAGEFGTPDHAQWQQLVAGVLRKTGALPEGFDGPPESLLSTRTYDGIDVRPLYTAEDTVQPEGMPGIAPFTRAATPARAGWDVRVLHADPDVAATNRAALADLEGGAGSLWLRLGAGGVPVGSLPEALAGVHLDLAPVVLEPGAQYEQAAHALLELYAEREVPASGVTGGIGADPIGLRARGAEPHDVEPAAELTARIAATHPGLRTLVADGLPFHEAGGSDAQELGAAIAAGVRYLRALTAAGLDIGSASEQLEFRLAATADQFLTIAKLRAARRVWARVLEASGVGRQPRGMRQHAVSSPAMLTIRDPWVNMLRGTLACFGAGIGGADAVTVLPFDSAIGIPDGFARRIARNTQAILLEECKLAGVLDPAGGSWYVENLTDELAHAAWEEFTAIERAGGIESELDSGALAARLARTWRERENRIATRKDPITGVTEFPDLAEQPVRRKAAPAESATGGLPRIRYAQDFERLRERSDAHLARHGARPRAFLATLGSVAAHTARATFASNLFQAGGIEPAEAGAVDDVVAAYSGSGLDVACICGSDAAYTEQAGEVAGRLKEAGARYVLLAGKPADYPTVDGYLYAGCDALEVLTNTLETLGVES